MADPEPAHFFDYLELDLEPEGWRALREARVTERSWAGGAPIALFAPQIGFRSSEAILLVGLRGHDSLPAESASQAARLPGVRRVAASERLVALLRGDPENLTHTPGMYAHRWFTLRAADLETFVGLSRRAWETFEEMEGTKVFGLFRRLCATDEAEDGTERLLLLTWYVDHSAWQRTRFPAAETRELFAQRAALTLETIVRTSSLVS